MPIKIVRGEDRVFNIKFSNRSNNEPYDLSGVTQITAKFNNYVGATPAQLVKTLGNGIVVVSTILGRIQVTINDTESAMLKVGERQNFEVWLDMGASRRIVQFLTEWTVIDKLS